MPRSIIQIYQLFFWRQPNKLFTLIVVTALMSLAQITSVALIMPFVRLIFSPHEAMENDTINGIYSYLNFSSLESFTLFVGAAVLLALILSNAFLALGTWYMARFTWQSQLLLSSKLLRKYLQYDYESFTGLNSADIQKNILFESAQVTTGTLMPLLNLIAYGITALLITSFLLWVDSNITLGLAAGLGLSYWVAYLAVKGPLQDSGAKRIAANSKRYKVVNEAFGGLKEIKILALEEDCEHRFFEAAKEFSTANVLQSTASQIPRYAIESIALCVLVGGLLVIAQTGQNLASVLPTVSAFALGAFRLLPALQKVFNSISTIRFNISALQTVHALHQRNQQAIPAPNSDSLPTFRQQIQLESVCYSYPNADTESIKSVSLTIRSGQLVALVGSTGAGKSTIADILMGLLPPSSGRLTVDGNEIEQKNKNAWCKQIGYVPQDIYLIDKSIAENIAFGEHPDEQDGAALIAAARAAQIHDFISNELPQGYGTIVGERGIRLSGGQKQRIGIARALYRNPSVLIMDEATSALDQNTERSVHKAIVDIAAHKTVILIAHRMNTVRDCDQIFVFEKGNLVASGDYGELSSTSPQFQQLSNTPNATTA